MEHKVKHTCTAGLWAALPWLMLCFLLPVTAYSQPANDNCANAAPVNISGGGFGLGVFPSSAFDLSSATVQPGETFAPAILVAGQNQKSVWYRFTLPTTRSVRVTLAQPGSLITAGDAGFAVYKANTCLPTGSGISTKITPIGIFGNSFHPCVDAGDYLVQVSSKASANGPVFITIETGQPTAAFDLPAQANYFGVLPAHASPVNFSFNVDCNTIDDANEICNTLGNYQDYTKSTWHVFTTPAYLDYLAYSVWGAFSKAGIKIYRGDVRSAPYASMPVVKACDSLPGLKIFDCNELNPNTTYSIQLFYTRNFEGNVNFSFYTGGFAPTIAPQPILSAVSATTNNLGVLPATSASTLIQRNDFLACNSRISLHPCSPSMPAGGIVWGGQRWNLSTFFMFNLSTTSSMLFNIANSNPAGSCGNNLLVRLFHQKVTNNCADLDTANIVAQFVQNADLNCLPPGDYTMQVLGNDSLRDQQGTLYCIRSNLGTIFDMNIYVKSIQAENRFSLSAPGKMDTLNAAGGVMQPLVPGTLYTSRTDTFGCAKTVMPDDPNCNPSYNRTIYREFNVPDSGMISMWSSGSGNSAYQVFKGDANALAISQNLFSYPGLINGLNPVTLCLDNTRPLPYVCDGTKVCVTPGTYTEAVYGNDNTIGLYNQFQVRFNKVATAHHSLATAENMGDILSIIPPTGGSFTSSDDYYSCNDNALVIDGFQPCPGGYRSPGTKAIYRQFYLSRPASISISSIPVGCDYTPFTLFKGKATDGIGALTVMPDPWRCKTSLDGGICNPLPAGWYTVVSYGWGPSYENPTRNLNDVYYGFPQYSSTVGFGNKITISLNVSTCPLPKYNRPEKAAIDTVTKQPFLIQWAPRVGSTSAYPRTDTVYNLYTENFLCPDTPFAAHPVLSCSTDPGMLRVAYYVFQVTQESFLSINSNSLGEGTRASVYAGNVRTTPNLLVNNSPIQPCIDATIGQLMLCNVQPGYYTLVIYAGNGMACRSITPSIYIDRMGYSRFDHANKAYDFGLIPSDSTWHSGKPGDVNPLDPGRAPSSDIFYCTTGSRPDDPAYGCWSAYLPAIYNPSINNPLFPNAVLGGTFGNTPYYPRRNLWYTFVADKGGWVRIRVKNKTPGKTSQYPYIVMKSDVNGALPFSTVVSMGGVDSTAAQGLIGAAGNAGSGQTCQGGEEVSFFRETCSPVTERYYIIVQNPADHGFLPNHQVEVSILFDSVNAIEPKFDHYYQASVIGTNLGPGTYNGQQANISCATRDATDPHFAALNCGDKTIWYKFSTTVSGYINMRFYNSALGYFDARSNRIQLYREMIPGDSTSNGLQYIPSNFANFGGGVYYERACISPGNYYILLPNCYLSAGDEYPEIVLAETEGDYCSRPVTAALNGAGTSVTSALVNCHTIGTDYGEFNPTITCPAGAITGKYKTTWFKINITGSDTLDVTTYLTENTNAETSQIKYRLMNGNCGAMQERSCVQDALTQDTYKCLAPGDYWVQVFTPVIAGGAETIGTIDLHLSAVKHADTCAPINPCLSNANFQKQFDCTQSTAVQFINYSTFGSSVSYKWDFGYAGKTSTATSPQFVYPSLTVSRKYYITLTVTNNSCGGSSTYRDSITIPARPVVNLGADTALCNGGSVVLNATSHAGATYQWSNNATTPTVTANIPGLSTYMVEVKYNGCIARDTIQVNIDPVNPVKETKYLCGIDPATLNALRGYGETFNWNTGAKGVSIIVFTPGIYWCDINLQGCITRDSFTVISASAPQPKRTVSVCRKDMPYAADATLAGATGYKWNDNNTNAKRNLATPGVWWVDVTIGGCTVRDSIVLSVDSFKTANISARICGGLQYTLPGGKKVNASGVYKDTLRNIRGCDSLITTLTLTVDTVKRAGSNVSVCAGQSFTLPSGRTINATGTYTDTVRYKVSGCDSLISNVNLAVAVVTKETKNATICSGKTYLLPGGKSVGIAGQYIDTLKAKAGCDSVIITTNLAVLTPIMNTSSASICFGQTFTLPSGRIIGTGGLYRDTIRYANGCDSLISNITLTVSTVTLETKKVFICEGGSYTLPGGKMVNATGVYKDTLRNVQGCDSLISTIDLTRQTLQRLNNNAFICSGQQYRLPSGKKVSATGIYRDTLRYTTGCDSVAYTIDLRVFTKTILTNAVNICFGKTYTLPSGKIAATLGLYRDTLRYTNGCDSLISNITLTVSTVTLETKKVFICEGGSYTLPGGKMVNATGVYKDTLRNVQGCDSLISTIDLTRQTLQRLNNNAFICSGQQYTLSSGKKVSATGIYRDTLRYTTGCDSVAYTIDLRVFTKTIFTNAVNICFGKTYTLPSGKIAATPGLYRDTLRYTNGCDSLISNITVTVSTVTLETKKVFICEGSSYILPGGKMVNTTGVYKDTLRNVQGCDSLISTIDLTRQTLQRLNNNAFICSGQQYTLPSGKKVSQSGIYNDTLRYTTGLPAGQAGCDSLVFTVNLAVFTATTITSAATICLGNVYTLPSGKTVSAAGNYRDTLRYVNGCDSIRYLISLTVTDALRKTATATICAGSPYTLPSGRLITNAGLYRDTVRTAQNCDSLISNITLLIDGVSSQTLSQVICQGTVYRLPSGKMVSTAGIHRDTLRNIRGCDSIRFTIDLSISATRYSNASATLCTGQAYTRPSGKIATAPGVYSDTLRSQVTGCDSIITTTLTFRPPLSVKLTSPTSVCTGVSATLTATASGGTGGPYTYSWTGAGGSGNTITVSPSSTTRYVVSVSDGCTVLPARDSVTITYVPPPQPGFNNATVTICRGSAITLSATGGATFQWSPATGLSNPAAANPSARPLTDTRYRVMVTTAQGCTGEDSILVKVTQPFTLAASPDTFVCAGGSVLLSAAGAVRYTWSGEGLSGTTGPSVSAKPNTTTTYTVTGFGTDNCFTQTKNIRVTVIALPAVNAGRDTTIMAGTSLLLRPAYTGNNLQYQWTPATYLSCTDCARPTATPREPIAYTITVKNAFGCTASDKLGIDLRCNAESVFLPNTFTPNGDGTNDIWYPRGGGIKTVRYLKVFNRLGQLVFERANFNTDDRSAGWDGTFRGKPVMPDVFIYTLAAICDNGQTVESKGNVMVVR